MRRMILFLVLFAGIYPGSATLRAQEIEINLVPYENHRVDAVWDAGSPSAAMYIQVINHSGLSQLPPYRAIIVIKLGSPLYCKWQVSALQSDLPPGWTVLFNDGTTIKLSNGTDFITPRDYRAFEVKVVAISPILNPLDMPQTSSAEMQWSTGVAPGTDTGDPHPEDIPGNNTSTAAYRIYSPVLPVKLTSFTGTAEHCTARLTWESAEESALSLYEVERSYAGDTYTVVGRVNPQGSGHLYTFTDNDAGLSTHETAIYRLRMTDDDGSYVYSKSVSVKFNCRAGTGIYAYPVPCKDHVTVVFPDGNQLENVKVFNAIGQALTPAYKLSAGQVEIETTKWPPGTYVIRLFYRNRGSAVVKAIKND